MSAEIHFKSIKVMFLVIQNFMYPSHFTQGRYSYPFSLIYTFSKQECIIKPFLRALKSIKILIVLIMCCLSDSLQLTFTSSKDPS